MILFLVVGVIAGLAIGVIPGLGGTGAVAVLLPFVFILEPAQAMALIIGAVAVVHTSDAVTSILIGIPGSAAAATLLLDGHEMAKKGQGARALSASFLSSMVGGLIGVVALTFAIPIARPLVMMLGSPEIFMLTVLGIALTAMLSKGMILKGLMAGLLGILLAQIGAAPTSPEYRYTFGSLFLTEGLGLVAVALGIFGVAEVMSLVARQKAISNVESIGSGWGQGVKDVVRHWFHVVRGAVTGITIGILPGVGATAGAWMAYGQAQATARGDDKVAFGKGDPRGVIAPSSAGNSIEAGALIPTLLFGIPGAAPFALLLGALLIFGIEPGPRILTQNLDVVYVIVWSFAIASIIGAAFCFVLAKPLAKLSFIRFPLLAAAIIPILFMSGFQEPLELPVVWVMLLVGIVGWLMKTFGVPRAPFLIGFVLALPLERYYFLTSNLYDFDEWVTRPAVLVMFGILILPLVLDLVRRVRFRGKVDAVEVARGLAGMEALAVPRSGAIYVSAGFLVLFSGGFLMAGSYSEAAALFPKLATGIGAVLSLIALCLDIVKFRKYKRNGLRHDRGEWLLLLRTVAVALLWILAFIALIYVFGMIVGTVVFVPLFLWLVAKARMRTIVVYPLVVLAFLLALQEFAQIVMPRGYIYLGI
ncbi:tripartite tricarboxylate transporter permease [Zhihengliuella halotolerans]|nr:tripartite tricarboxylate transporter permease [Zhihengliuella halotolerans]